MMDRVFIMHECGIHPKVWDEYTDAEYFLVTQCLKDYLQEKKGHVNSSPSYHSSSRSTNQTQLTVEELLKHKELLSG